MKWVFCFYTKSPSSFLHNPASQSQFPYQYKLKQNHNSPAFLTFIKRPSETKIQTAPNHIGSYLNHLANAGIRDNNSVSKNPNNNDCSNGRWENHSQNQKWHSHCPPYRQFDFLSRRNQTTRFRRTAFPPSHSR